MVNKRVTSEDDPLVQVIVLLKKSQKSFLDTLGKSGRSAYIRKLLDSQMNTNPHAVEAEKLEEENKMLESRLKINKAQIDQYKVESEKHKITAQTRDQLLDKTSDLLINFSSIIDFSDRQFIQVFKNNVNDANRILGQNGDPITSDELKVMIVRKAEAKGKMVL